MKGYTLYTTTYTAIFATTGICAGIAVTEMDMHDRIVKQASLGICSASLPAHLRASIAYNNATLLQSTTSPYRRMGWLADTGRVYDTYASMIDGDKRDDSIMQFLTTDRHVQPIDAHMQAILQSASVELSMIDGDKRDYKHILSLMVGSGFESVSSVPSILSHTAT